MKIALAVVLVILVGLGVWRLRAVDAKDMEDMEDME